GGFFVYIREVMRDQDYYPFGSLLPGRNYCSDSYNFGFNGQLKDDEVHGATGTSYAFEYRMHDPRIGRFLSTDPVGQAFPYWSPYHFAANSPIWCMDWDGLQPVTRQFTHQGTTHTFRTRRQNPQKLKIDGVSYDFFSEMSGRNPNSLALLKGGHSRQLRRNADVEKMAAIHRGVMVNELLLSVLEQHPDIGLVIIGNHNVPTSEEAGPIGTARGEADLKDTDGHVVVPHTSRTRDSEIAWTRERAGFIREQFFDDSDLVGFGSVADYRQRDFPSVPFRPLGDDAVGITITFDFRNTVDDHQQREATKRDRSPSKPKDRTQYRNVRHL
ncbi:MAG TPA: RHS repeat-associated core domain-containing protein, partial [Flavobacteriales bacterium]|nr:RHS repeat-associated core domain-containing protein [Flavobacteriales bacterium]